MALPRDEHHVGLEHERALEIQDDVERRDRDGPQAARLDVIAQEARDPQDQRLMREERRRRLAQHATRELAAPGGFVGLQVFKGGHDADDGIVQGGRPGV